MLIKDIPLDDLHLSDLACPDSFFWPGYIWFWNDLVTEDIIKTQLEDMCVHGAKSVWPFAWPNFRPDFNPTSMEPEYLSNEFLDLFRLVAQHATRLGMRVWLYDEGGWPSGSAFGKVVRENPSLLFKPLERKLIPLTAGESIKVPEDALAVFLVNPDGSKQRLTPGTEITGNKNSVLHVYSQAEYDINAPNIIPYPDHLKPIATESFIRHTHEAYKAVASEYFGDTIPLAFTDEPRLCNCPWTDDAKEDFERQFGYDLTDHLPAIFDTDSSDGANVRVDYFDWWSRRYADTFFGGIKDWCHSNSLLSAGHLGGEDSTSGSRVHGYGHILRVLREFDIPSVDTIWRQLFPGELTMIDHSWAGNASKIPSAVNHHFPKFASSVAHQKELKWAATESFCVYGSGITPAQMKWVTDFQYVRGINLMTMGGYSTSTRDYYMGGQRPNAGPGNPMWKYSDLYHSCTARLSYIMSLGKPDIDIAVYLPIRDMWAAGPDMQAIELSHDQLAKTLLQCQCDFDVIDDDILENKSTQIADGTLAVGPMRYQTIILARTDWISEASKATLERFRESGGRVLQVDGGYNCEDTVELQQLPGLLQPVVDISPANPMIRACKRTTPTGSIYLVTNEGTTGTSTEITFEEPITPVQIDPETGACWKVSDARIENGRCVMPLIMDFAGSCILWFSDSEVDITQQPAIPGDEVLNLNTGWSCKRVREYRIGEHDFEVADISEEAVNITLGDWSTTFGDGFSGDAQYCVEFDCDEALLETAAALDLGDVHCACEVSINGKSLGRKSWPPYCFPLAGTLRNGSNYLAVTITNTMANQFVTGDLQDRWPDNVIGPYHSIALGLEKDSMASGLAGPVRLRNGKHPIWR